MKVTKKFRPKNNIINQQQLYLKGRIKAICPKCNKQLVLNFDKDEDYIYCPEIGAERMVSFFCKKCGKYYSMTVIIKDIRIDLEYDRIFLV